MIKKYSGQIKFTISQKIDDEFVLKNSIHNFIKSLIGSRFYSDSIVIEIIDVAIKGIEQEESGLLLEEEK